MTTTTLKTGDPASTTENLERLEQVLGDHQKLAADLENYQTKAAGALADQESALANQSIPEQEGQNLPCEVCPNIGFSSVDVVVGRPF